VMEAGVGAEDDEEGVSQWSPVWMMEGGKTAGGVGGDSLLGGARICAIVAGAGTVTGTGTGTGARAGTGIGGVIVIEGMTTRWAKDAGGGGVAGEAVGVVDRAAGDELGA